MRNTMTFAPDRDPLPFVTVTAAIGAAGSNALSLIYGGWWVSAIALALGLVAAVGASATIARTIARNRRRSQQLHEQFAEARVLSHEIRTPLAVIVGSAELLSSAKDALDRDQQGFLQAIVTNSKSLQRLVDDLLAQARIDADLFTVRLETVDYRDLIRRIVDELRVAYPAEILLSNLRAPVLVEADPGLLRQVLNNLVSNCLRHGEEQMVLIRVARQEEGVLTVVSDFGPGLQRGRDVNARRHPESNGIGLRVVRNIVKSHGGGVFFASTPGFGTSASVYLPQSPSEVARVRAR